MKHTVLTSKEYEAVSIAIQKQILLLQYKRVDAKGTEISEINEEIELLLSARPKLLRRQLEDKEDEES